jgi:predicted nucleic acid-binding protein
MSAAFDTNILVYAVTADAKAKKARELIEAGGSVSAIVLNEFVDVARRKFRKDWPDVRLALAYFSACVEQAQPFTFGTHELGLEIASRHGLRIYDACIIASAALAGCDTLYTEDMNHGQVIEGVRVINPFL